MKTRLASSLVLSSMLLAASFASGSAFAADTDKDKEARAECVSSFETSQELRANSDLTGARTRLLGCIRPECPGSVRNECTKLLEQVEREVPSLVVVAKADGEDRTDVKVEMDGKVIQESLDGKAIQVNPGSHVFRFSLAPFEAIEKRVVVGEGDKLRSVGVEFVSPKKDAPLAPAPAPAPVKLMHRPVPASVYVLGGVAVLGGASFAYFGSTGSSKQDDLQASCAPGCSSSDVKEVRRNYLLADVSLGVGAAALITGAVLLFTRPERPLEEGAEVSVAPTNGGLSANARFRF